MADRVRSFASLGELIDYAKTPTDMSDYDRQSLSTTQERVDFTASASFEEACTLAHRWDDGVKRMQALAVQIMQSDQRPRTVVRKSPVPPGALDIPGVVSGDPGAGFLHKHRVNAVQKNRGRVVDLLVSTGVHGGIKADTIMRRGAAILALVDILERKGMRVAISGASAVRSGHDGREKGDRLEYRWTVKRADQRASLAALAFGLAHPSMHRRMVFALREHEDVATRRYYKIGTGYGVSVDPGNAEAVMAKGGIYVGLFNDFHSDEDARNWVQAQVDMVMSRR